MYVLTMHKNSANFFLVVLRSEEPARRVTETYVDSVRSAMKALEARLGRIKAVLDASPALADSIEASADRKMLEVCSK